MRELSDKYLKYLPPILFQKEFWQRISTTNHEKEPAEPAFLTRFLRIFEQQFNRIEENIDGIPRLFNPATTPAEFLNWLAAWFALEVDEQWDERQIRSVLGSINDLYQKRGRMDNLRRYLNLYVTDATVKIAEMTPEDSPEWRFGFKVLVEFPYHHYPRRPLIARAIRQMIEREKPAHTFYYIDFLSPTLQVGVHSTVGEDTILGNILDNSGSRPTEGGK